MQLIPGAAVLIRPDGAVQVGIASPVVFANVTDDERCFLTMLEDGLATWADARRHHDIVARLSSAGLIQEEAATPTVVRVHHHGRMGIAIAVAAARAGLRVGFTANTTPLHGQQSAWWRATQAVHQWVPEWTPPPVESPADIDVLIGAGATPALAATLVARDRPHVIVTTNEAGIAVGPVVVPGATACGTCADLAVADGDPSWAQIALQCHARPPRADPALVDAAGSLVALACLTLTSRPQDHRGSARRWQLSTTGALTASPVAAHPRCSCGATGMVGDELAARRSRLPS